MLSVPTLWTVFVVNFLALGLIWAYVVRSYPSFEAARFWTGSAFVAAGGATIAMLRVVFPDSLMPLLVGGTGLVLATCLAMMGISGFTIGRSRGATPRRSPDCSFVGLSFFIVGYDSMPMRILIFSLGQSVPMSCG